MIVVISWPVLSLLALYFAWYNKSMVETDTIARRIVRDQAFAESTEGYCPDRTTLLETRQ
jgi:hypothetical protein